MDGLGIRQEIHPDSDDDLFDGFKDFITPHGWHCENIKQEYSGVNSKPHPGPLKGGGKLAKNKQNKSGSWESISPNQRKMIIGLVAGIVIVSVLLGYFATNPVGKKISVQTDKGTFVMEVYPNLMPNTSKNFIQMVEEQFYNGLTFHRVEESLIQGGDPEGDGTGGPGWAIPLEINKQLKHERGAVAMARSEDPNSAGSQFYIVKKDMPALDGKYAVFGQVVEGMAVVDKIKAGDKMIEVEMK